MPLRTSFGRGRKSPMRFDVRPLFGGQFAQSAGGCHLPAVPRCFAGFGAGRGRQFRLSVSRRTSDSARRSREVGMHGGGMSSAVSHHGPGRRHIANLRDGKCWRMHDRKRICERHFTSAARRCFKRRRGAALRHSQSQSFFRVSNRQLFAVSHGRHFGKRAWFSAMRHYRAGRVDSRRIRLADNDRTQHILLEQLRGREREHGHGDRVHGLRGGFFFIRRVHVRGGGDGVVFGVGRGDGSGKFGRVGAGERGGCSSGGDGDIYGGAGFGGLLCFGLGRRLRGKRGAVRGFGRGANSGMRGAGFGGFFNGGVFFAGGGFGYVFGGGGRGDAFGAGWRGCGVGGGGCAGWGDFGLDGAARGGLLRVGVAGSLRGSGVSWGCGGAGRGGWVSVSGCDGGGFGGGCFFAGAARGGWGG